MSYFIQLWPIYEPYDPLRGSLQDQQSTFDGSYSTKSLHKLVLPENGFISIFVNQKCSKSAQIVIFHAI